MAGRLTLSSSTPRPTRMGTALGSPAIPPHTPIGAERLGAPDGLRDEPEHGRVQAVHLRRELRMAAVHREGVLREIVRPDREEVASRRTASAIIAAAGTSTMMPAATGGHPGWRLPSPSIALTSRSSCRVAIIGNITLTLPKPRRGGSRAAACAGFPGGPGRPEFRARRGTDCPPWESANRRAACRRRRPASG